MHRLVRVPSESTSLVSIQIMPAVWHYLSQLITTFSWKLSLMIATLVAMKQ